MGSHKIGVTETNFDLSISNLYLGIKVEGFCLFLKKRLLIVPDFLGNLNPGGLRRQGGPGLRKTC